MEQYANNLEALVEERTADYLVRKAFVFLLCIYSPRRLGSDAHSLDSFLLNLFSLHYCCCAGRETTLRRVTLPTLTQVSINTVQFIRRITVVVVVVVIFTFAACYCSLMMMTCTSR